MASITARGCYKVADFTTERTIKNSLGESCLTREKFAIRSDGKVLHRILWTEVPGSGYGKYRNPKHPDRLTHNSAYSIKLSWKNPLEPQAMVEHLERFLERRGFKIVKRG